MARSSGAAALVAALLVPSAALAHGHAEASAVAGADPLTPILLAAGLLLYLGGLRRLKWRRSWRAAAFLAGWLGVAVALLPPLAAFADVSFLAHMVEHELLMLVAAPLLVLARPIPVLLLGLPRRWRRGLGRTAHGLRPLWRILINPAVAFALHGAALWVWHAPPLFAAALDGTAAHWAQHLSFFLTALLYWWSLLGRRGRDPGTAVLSLFLTATHSGVLGALMTFSGAVWYRGYGGAFGLSALEDQQLAGLVMWVPAGAVYLVAALGILGRWLGRAERGEGQAHPSAHPIVKAATKQPG